MSREPRSMPPRIARRVLLAAAAPDDRWTIVDDLDEEYESIAARDGPSRAARWYRSQALVSAPVLLAARAGRAVRALRRGGGTIPKPRRGDPMLRELSDDLRYAARRARARPLVAGTTLVLTALAVGATTAAFSVVNGLLLRPLPLPEPDRVVRIMGVDSRFLDDAWGGVSFPNGNDIAARSRTLQQVALYNQNWSGTLLGGDEPRPVQYALVGHDFAAVLGVRPLLGRWFVPEEHRPGADDVVVLTHEGWQREFGGDSAIVGRAIIVDDEPLTVVGVLPPLGLEFPRAELAFWTPLAPATTGSASWRSGRMAPWLSAVGRLRPGTSLEQANAELAVIARQLAVEHPAINETKSYHARSLQEAIVGPVRSMLWLLSAAVAGVLLVACADVAMLLLASAAQRRGEFAVRAALGGTGARVARQVLTEAVALTALGGVLGIALAPVILAAFLGMYPEPLPSRAQIVLDARVLAVGIATIGIGALLAGLPAARQARSLELGDRLRDWRRAAGGRTERRRTGALIAAQVALSVTLLFAAGLLLRSFWNLTHVELGFEPRGVLTFWLTPSRTHGGRSADALYDELTESLRVLPGVRSVATSFDIPTAGRSFGTSVRREGASNTPERSPTAGVQMVSAGFFPALGIPLRAGRGIGDEDRRGAPFVVVVNESFTARMFPGERALGRRIVVWDTVHTIVGVVGDARRGRPLWDPPEPEMYFAADQRGQSWRYVLVRAESGRDLDALVPSIRAEVRRLDPSLPLAELASLEDRLREAATPQRFRGALVGSLGAIALVLSMVGIYGVVAYSVSQRTREIGIRLALGEAQRAVRLRMVAQALAPAALGVVAGSALAGMAARWLERFVLGVPPRDMATLGAVAALFLIVATVAAYAPARRASRIDPTMALRAE